MESVEIKEIMEIISNVSNESLHNISSYSEHLANQLSNSKLILKKLQSQTADMNVLKKVDNTAATNKIKETCNKNKEHVKKVQRFLEEQENKGKELKTRNSEIEEEIKNLEQKLIHIQAKHRGFERKRDKLLAYKLLTNTHFCYETKNVKGFTIGLTPDNVKSFDLNTQKMSTKEITQALYSNIKKVYCDPSRKVEEK